MNTSRRLAVLLCLCALALPLSARGKKSSSTQPGTYKEWGPDIDRIEIVQTFKFSDYTRVAVVEFDTSEVKLPEKDDNTFEPVRKVLASATEGLVQGIRGEIEARVTVEEKAPESAGTLVIRGKIVELDPGSKSARYFAGFGAGAARVKIEAEVVDAGSGRVLARFEQERRSGVGVMGGDYQELMQRSLNAVGEDVANLLKAF